MGFFKKQVNFFSFYLRSLTLILILIGCLFFLSRFLLFITRANCALYRRTISCVYVPGFHRQILKYNPKYIWIPLTKFPWVPRTNTCNVNFVGPFVVSRIPRQANIVSCCGFRRCKWILRNENRIRKICKMNPQMLVDSANCKWIQNLV